MTPEQEALVSGNLKLAFWFANRYRRFDPEGQADLESEAQLGLVRAALEYEPRLGGAFGSFAAVVIKRRIFDYLRRTRKQKAETSLYLHDDEGNEIERRELRTDPDPAAPVLHAQVRRAVAALGPRHRDVVLRWLAGRTLEEVAVDLGVSRARCGHIEKAAMRTLRKALGAPKEPRPHPAPHSRAHVAQQEVSP